MFKPLTTPKVGKEEVEDVVSSMYQDSGLDRAKYPCCIVGVRGYYLKTMDKKDNQRGLYDDAAFIITPDVFYAVNFNTDPTRVRKGYGTDDDTKGMATLNYGLWWYKTGIHKTYAAFVQADEVTVTRDGTKEDYEDTGWFGVNIHKGGYETTSSLGCQTVYPAQWDTFKRIMYQELDKHGQKKFPYILAKYIPPDER